MSYDPYIAANLAQIKAARQRKQRIRYRQKAKKPKYQLDLNYGSATQKQGQLAESLASQFILHQGLTILAQNLACRAGEIDILAIDNTIIVFIEVRKRKSSKFGDAAASVNIHKQRRIIRAANYFLPHIYKFTGHKMACRFDVITIDNGQINWLKHAFSEH